LSILSYSQEILWQDLRVDKNLTVSLPGNVNKIDTFYFLQGKKTNFKMFIAQTEFSAIGVVASNEFDANINNKETLENVLDKVAISAIKKMKEGNMDCFASDTLLFKKLPCKKIKCFGKKNGNLMHILLYTIVVNDIVYTMQGAFVPELASGGLMEMDRLLKSIKIDINSIKELEFESKAFSQSYKFGYFIGMLIIPAIIIGLIIYFVRRK